MCVCVQKGDMYNICMQETNMQIQPSMKQWDEMPHGDLLVVAIGRLRRNWPQRLSSQATRWWDGSWDGSFHNMASPVPPIQGFIHKPQLKILGCSMIFLAPQLKIAWAGGVMCLVAGARSTCKTAPWKQGGTDAWISPALLQPCHGFQSERTNLPIGAGAGHAWQVFLRWNTHSLEL